MQLDAPAVRSCCCWPDIPGVEEQGQVVVGFVGRYLFAHCVLKIGATVVGHRLCVFLTEDGLWEFIMQVLVDNFHIIRYDGKEPSDLAV